MIEAAVIALRLVQYVSGSILFGSALFLVYALPKGSPSPRWARPLLIGGAVSLALAAALGLVAQTVALAGSVKLGLNTESLRAMALETALGTAALVRSAAAALAGISLAALPPGPRAWSVAGSLGAIAVASFAWMGHAAAAEGPGATLQVSGDIVHALTAALWIGALIAFVPLTRSAGRTALHSALLRFSALGVPLVALIIATGLVNSWFLVGVSNLPGLLAAPYGRLLALKLALFAAMLALAAVNRWRHTPALATPDASLAPVRRSLAAEALLGLLLLAVVAWLGMSEPLAYS